MKEFNNTLLNLELLAEECAEVIQSKSKLVRWGVDHTNPLTGRPAIEGLENEIGDLLAIIDILKINGTILPANIIRARDDKLKRLQYWYNKDACRT